MAINKFLRSRQPHPYMVKTLEISYSLEQKTNGLGTWYVALGMWSVIPVAIAAIYLSKQGVSDLGYTQAHVSFRL